MSKLEQHDRGPVETPLPVDARVLELAAALSEGSRESLLLLDGAGGVHFVRGGEPLAPLLGMTPEELEKGWTSLLAEDDLEKIAGAHRRALRLGRAGASVVVQKHERPPLELEVRFSNLLMDERVRALVVRIRELPGAQSQAFEPPPEDLQPNGLVSPQRFRELLQRAVDQKQAMVWSRDRYSRSLLRERRYDFALVRLDLDQARAILGVYGEEVTKKLFERVAEQLLAVLRDRDALTDLGHGEYAILLDGIGDAEQADRVTHAIMQVIGRRIDVDGHAIATAPVVGIATSQRQYAHAEEVMRDAAAASLRARRQRGTRRAAFQTSMRTEDQRRIRLMAEMPEAIERGDFYLCYQPIVELASGGLYGLEALARWRHRELGSVAPSVFVPLAEETGAIRVLGEWVLETACRQMADWRSSHLAALGLVLAVNLSAAQLLDDGVLTMVESVLGATGLPPECLDLELTESVALEQTESAAQQVARLKLYGVTFSLDDFGTGYSSLSYLHRLDYDALKLDRTFLGQPSGAQREVMRSIVTLAHALGMRVVAEGVETSAELGVVRELGCDAAQGFHLAHPLEAQDAEKVVRLGSLQAGMRVD